MGSATSRRSFLRAGAVAAAAAGGISSRAWGETWGQAAGVAGENRRRPQIRLGVASYSFHKFDRAHVIEFMKQLGTSWLNAKDVNDHLPSTPANATGQAVAAYTAAGIQVTAAGVIYFPKKDSADIEEKFQYATRAGLSLIIGSPTRESLPELEKFVQQYDIRLAIHNHGPEDKEWPSPLDVLKVIQPMDRRIGLCIDVGHTARTGTDVIEAIRKGGSRVFNIHMKDLADMAVKESQVAVGDGKMPVRGIFEALHAMDYRGFVDLEYEIHDDDPLPGMIKSFAYMRGVLAGMEYQD
jgi:sugar phosphate isomerase/epimerase